MEGAARSAMLQPAVRVASAQVAVLREQARRAAADNLAAVQDAASQAALLAVRSFVASSNVTRATINAAQASLSSAGAEAISVVHSATSDASSRASQAAAVVGAAVAAARGVVEERASRLTARQRKYILWAGVAAALGSGAMLAYRALKESSALSMSADRDTWWRMCGMEEASCEEALRRKLVSAYMSAVRETLTEIHCISDKQALLRSLKGRNTPFDKRSRKAAVKALTVATFSRTIGAAFALVIGEGVVSVQVSELQGLDDAGVRLGEQELGSYLNILYNFTNTPTGLMALASAVERSVARVMKGHNEASRVSAADVVALMDEVVRDAEVQCVVQAALGAVATSAQAANNAIGDGRSQGSQEQVVHQQDGGFEGSVDGGGVGKEEEKDGDDASTAADDGFSSIINATCATLGSQEALSRIHSNLSTAVSLIASSLTASLTQPQNEAATSPLPPSPPPCGGPQAHGVDGTPPGGDMSKSLSPAASLQEGSTVASAIDPSAPSPSVPESPCEEYDWAAGVCGSVPHIPQGENIAKEEGGWGVYEEGVDASPCMSEDGGDDAEAEEGGGGGGGGGGGEVTLDILGKRIGAEGEVVRLKAPASTPASEQAAYTTPVISASLLAPASGGHNKQQLFKGGSKDTHTTSVFRLVPVMSGVFGKICSAADGAAGNPFVSLLGPVL